MVVNDKYGFKKGCIEILNQYKLYKIRKSGKRVEIFEIKCNLCGSKHIVERSGVLRRESSYEFCKSCFNNLNIGDKIGRLTLLSSFIRIVGNNDLSNKYWNCLCECGNKSCVSNSILRRGKIYSCGKCKDIFRPTHSEHYDRVLNIIKRCTNIHSIDYQRYGGRGIKNLLGSTIEEMIKNLERVPNYEHGLQLDRIDNDGHYTIEHPIYGSNIWIDEYGHACLGNLRWVDPYINSNNRSKRNDLSREIVFKLFNNFNTIDELRDLFTGTYLFNYMHMFLFIPNDEIYPESFRLVIFPHYIHIFKRFVTLDDEHLYLSLFSEYIEDYEFEIYKSLEIVQRLFL